MILIGSRAINHFHPDFKPNSESDFDYIITDSNNKPELIDGYRIETHNNPVISKLYNEDDIITMDHLLTLKMSHLLYDINWAKHMYHSQWLMKMGYKYDLQLFYELVEYWREYHPKNRRSNLQMSKDEFFTNAINYDTHQHDDLHLIINPIPMYTRLLKENEEVELDEEKFHILSEEEKMEVVREEVYVMAFERYAKLNYRIAYKRMLDKFIRTHAPVYMIPFIVENYIELLKPKFDFIQVIEEGLKINKIK